MLQTAPTLDPHKFRDPAITLGGQARASVGLRALETLWFNTGTVCNLTCRNCYIESSPGNDRLAYLSADEAAAFLDEVARDGLPVGTVGFTGGEPFMNPDFPAMLADTLARGHEALVLTNGMRPMMRAAEALLAMKNAAWPPLAGAGLGRSPWRRSARGGARAAELGAHDRGAWTGLGATGSPSRLRGGCSRTSRRRRFGPGSGGCSRRWAWPSTRRIRWALVLFPELDATVDVPEITEACWGILGRTPDSVMCSSSRMVVRRRGEAAASVVACTLLPYEREFDLGPTLAAASRAVPLNHPHCARFCVLGGAACSR